MSFANVIKSSKSKLAIITIIASITVGSSLLPAFAHAAVTNPVAASKVSFTFDDSLASAYTTAAPTLAKYGLVGTDYAISGCIGMSTVPNTCHANTDAKYMTWDQLTALQNQYGWEIGSHTVTHPYLATFDATDGQPSALTDAQVVQELTQSKADLAAHGINATDFSTPYGDYNNNVLAQIAKVYASHRGFADQNNNGWPYNDYLLNDFQVQEKTTTVAQAKAKIDAAIAGKYWLVLTFHDIMAKPSNQPDDYQYSTAELDQIAAYVKTKQDAGLITSSKINQGLVTSDTNMLANGSFNDGIADGWSTDNATSFVADNGNNGSYPDPTNAIRFASSASGNAHLFSPKVGVNSNTTYMLKNFLNVKTRTTGEVGFYIDEYDVNGNWISGQFKKAENSAFVENLNFTYKPSSASVSTASLQVYVAGTGISGYLDNTQMFALSTTAPPVQTNLMPNGTFDSGITGGWSTDGPTTITADSSSNGSPSNPVNSVKAVASTANKHLFSPKISVSSTHNYTLSNYLNVKTLTSGEVGFYIDEYDVNGNWISGQYKFGVRTVSSGDVNLSYTPSSANVAKASLQVIVVGNSGITAYFDDSRWYQN